MSTHRTVARIIENERVTLSEGHSLREVIPAGHFEEFDPFLLLNEDWFTPGTFGDHPHRGFQTVTYIIEGTLAHRDNRGHAGLLRAGDAQWMTAGRGIVHSEEPAAGVVHSLQLWINLPSRLKMTEPHYEDLHGSQMPVRRFDGAELRDFEPQQNLSNITMIEMSLEEGASVTQSLPAEDNAFLYILQGRGAIGGTPVRQGQTVWLSRRGDDFTIAAAEEPLRAMLWSGKPIGEPVVQYGPFVMNTPEEIRQAYFDFRAGRF